MAKDRKEQKKKIIDKKVSQINNSLNKGTLFNNLKDNLSYMKELFVDDDLFIIREIENNFNPSFRCAIAYCEGLINPNIINESIIKPLMISKNIKKDDTLIDHLAKRIIQLYNIKKTKIIKDIVESVTYGDVILFIDGIAEVLILNVKKFEARSLTEPENEKILIGPREGFIEFLPTNLSLIRRRLRTNKLKFKYLSFGDKTNTQACICYIDGIVDKKILAELYKRLKKIKIDGVIDTNYITELIKDNRFSPYRTTGYTEKPDVVVGKLLEGRIAIVLDGSPIVLTIPYFFVENFQTSEDYYMNFYYTSFVRILRILGYFFSITVPAFYLAIIAFHQELLPTPLFINIALERQTVPLPTTLEMIVLLTVFDILKEAGERMPKGIGQSLPIVGAIVIGQAAVEAKLIAGPMIIIVTFTGITSLLIPKLNAPIIIFQIMLLLLSTTLGLFGLTIGLSYIIIHTLNLKSFGISQINLTGEFKYQTLKDTIFRAPWWQMKKRPKQITKNQIRMQQTEAKQNV